MIREALVYVGAVAITVVMVAGCVGILWFAKWQEEV